MKQEHQMNPFWKGRNLLAIPAEDFGALLPELQTAYDTADQIQAGQPTRSLPPYYATYEQRYNDAWQAGRCLYVNAQTGRATSETILRAQFMEMKYLSHPQLIRDFWDGMEGGAETLAIFFPKLADRHPAIRAASLDECSTEELVRVLKELDEGSELADGADEGPTLKVPVYFDCPEKIRGTARGLGLELYRRGGMPLMQQIHFTALQSSRLIDVFWDSIGPWQG